MFPRYGLLSVVHKPRPREFVLITLRVSHCPNKSKLPCGSRIRFSQILMILGLNPRAYSCYCSGSHPEQINLRDTERLKRSKQDSQQLERDSERKPEPYTRGIMYCLF